MISLDRDYRAIPAPKLLNGTVCRKPVLMTFPWQQKPDQQGGRYGCWFYIRRTGSFGFAIEKGREDSGMPKKSCNFA